MLIGNKYGFYLSNLFQLEYFRYQKIVNTLQAFYLLQLYAERCTLYANLTLTTLIGGNYIENFEEF